MKLGHLTPRWPPSIKSAAKNDAVLLCGEDGFGTLQFLMSRLHHCMHEYSEKSRRKIRTLQDPNRRRDVYIFTIKSSYSDFTTLTKASGGETRFEDEDLNTLPFRARVVFILE